MWFISVASSMADKLSPTKCRFQLSTIEAIDDGRCCQCWSSPAIRCCEPWQLGAVRRYDWIRRCRAVERLLRECPCSDCHVSHLVDRKPTDVQSRPAVMSPVPLCHFNIDNTPTTIVTFISMQSSSTSTVRFSDVLLILIAILFPPASAVSVHTPPRLPLIVWTSS